MRDEGDSRTPAGKWGRWIDLLLAAVILAVVYWGRQKFIAYPLPLNPDEAQVGANVLRVMAKGPNWDGLDGSSTGPLNTLAAAWPLLLGQDVTFTTLRLTAYALVCITTMICYATLATLTRRVYAIAFTLPLALFYAFSREDDLQHYSSELLPVALVATALWLLACLDKARFRRPVLIAAIGLVLGAVPLAKMQVAPIGAIVFVFTCRHIALRSSSRAREFLLLFVPALVPAGAFLLPLLARGHFADFWNSYLVWASLYVSPPLTPSELASLFASDAFLLRVLVVAAVGAVLAVVFPARKSVFAPRPWLFLFLCTSLVAVAVIVRPGQVFVHYALLLPPFLMLLVGYMAAGGEPDGHSKNAYRSVLCLGVALCFLPIGSATPAPAALRSAKPDFRSPHLFDPLGTRAGDSLLVWGWMPQWYVWAGLPPAVRSAVSYNELEPGRLQPYFRRRFLSDFQSLPPAMILDAVTGQSFGLNDPNKAGIARFPELAAIVASDYVQARGLGVRPSCPAVYLRRDREKAAAATRVKFRAIVASASKDAEHAATNLDDWSVTEDTCADAWLLPDGATGHVDLAFEAPSAVQTIQILNTRGGEQMDRGTNAIRVVLLRAGRQVFLQESRLARYPRWTVIALRQPVSADSLRIEVLGFTGAGGGLNEVKVLSAATR